MKWFDIEKQDGNNKLDIRKLVIVDRETNKGFMLLEKMPSCQVQSIGSDFRAHPDIRDCDNKYHFCYIRDKEDVALLSTIVEDQRKYILGNVSKYSNATPVLVTDCVESTCSIQQNGSIIFMFESDINYNP